MQTVSYEYCAEPSVQLSLCHMFPVLVSMCVLYFDLVSMCVLYFDLYLFIQTHESQVSRFARILYTRDCLSLLPGHHGNHLKGASNPYRNKNGIYLKGWFMSQILHLGNTAHPQLQLVCSK